MIMSEAYAAADMIRQRTKYTPKIAIILGSGAGGLAQIIEDPVVIPYAELPGFHVTTVAGHHGNLYIGMLEGVPVVCLQGRAHYYEGVSNTIIKNMIRTLKLLGCEILLATNAAGSLRKNVKPGSLVLVKDHINFQFNNVLVGDNDEAFGPRFLSVQELYSAPLRKQLLRLAKRLKLRLSEGVYIGVLGPNFETPAEIKAFRQLGVDLVGMSTIPEVIVAHHCNMQVAVISVVTNLASGLATTLITHEETLEMAKKSAQALQLLMTHFVAEYR